MPYSDLQQAIELFIPKINNVLGELLPQSITSLDFINEAMLYSTVQTGGHRWRPFILRQCVGGLGYCEGSMEYDQISLYLGAAIEMIHNFSLIHDDLPCIDNSHERRGYDSCHAKFGESIALLAGNALLCEAFKVVSNLADTVECSKLVHIIFNMAQEVGIDGMLKGQQMDIIANNEIQCNDEEYEIIEQNIVKKTTSLFILACRVAGVLCNATEHQMNVLSLYGQNFGKMYQILDDIKDETDIKGLPLELKIKAHQEELENTADEIANIIKVLPDSVFQVNLANLPYYLYEKYLGKWNNQKSQ